MAVVMASYPTSGGIRHDLQNRQASWLEKGRSGDQKRTRIKLIMRSRLQTILSNKLHSALQKQERLVYTRQQRYSDVHQKRRRNTHVC